MASESDPNKNEVLLELNFVPTWARKPPAINNPYPGEDDSDRPADAGRGRGGDSRGNGERRFLRRSGGGERPRHDGRRERRPDASERTPSMPPSAPRERPPRIDLPVEVSFIPEKQRLGGVVKQIRTSNRAYPLMDLAALFLDHPEGYAIKLEARRQDDRPLVTFYQCEICKAVFLSKEDVTEHVAEDHLDTFFDCEEIETEAPSGQFVCVGRCKLSGTLVGPPNYHGFEERIRELHRQRFSHLSPDDYRAQIEMVHDPELIEQWKQQTRKQRRYRLKGTREEPPKEMTLAQARTHFNQSLADTCYVATARAMIPPGQGRSAGDYGVRQVMRRAWNRESRQPHSLAVALRPAFKHMGLHLFKAGQGITFVTAIKPKPLDAEHAIDSIREALNYLREHPGCTRQQMLTELRPDGTNDPKVVAEVLNPLRWLIERGSVIEFFNGTLSVPVSRSKAQL